MIKARVWRLIKILFCFKIYCHFAKKLKLSADVLKFIVINKEIV